MAKKERYSVDIVKNVSGIKADAPVIQDEAKRKSPKKNVTSRKRKSET